MHEDSRPQQTPLADQTRGGEVEAEDAVVETDAAHRAAAWLRPPTEGPEIAPYDERAHEGPPREVGERDTEVDARLRVVEDMSEEPAVAAYGEGIDDHVQAGHEDAREGHRLPSARLPERPARQAVRGIGEEGKRERIEEGHVRDEELAPRRGPRVVVETEGNPDARRPVLRGERDEKAPPEPSRHAQPAEIASGQEQKGGEEGEDVGSLRGAGRQEAQPGGGVGAHAATVANSLAIFNVARVPACRSL